MRIDHCLRLSAACRPTHFLVPNSPTALSLHRNTTTRLEPSECLSEQHMKLLNGLMSRRNANLSAVHSFEKNNGGLLGQHDLRPDHTHRQQERAVTLKFHVGRLL